MLSEEALEKLSERLVNRIEELNYFMIQKLGEQIVDIGELTPSQLKEVFQSIKYGNNLDEIINEIAEITDKNVEDIYEIFEEVAKKNQRYAKQFYEYKKAKFIPYDKNKTLQQHVRNIAKATAESYINMSKNTAYALLNNIGELEYTSLSKIYQEITDRAILNVAQGRESYQQVMRDTMKVLTHQGLRTVDYASGYSRRMDSSVRMNLMDGVRHLNQELQKEFGKEFGADGVEVSHHKNPAPDHEDTIDGKQFSKEEFEQVNESLERHVGELNCYHFIYPIILGVTEPMYSEEQLKKDKEANKKGFEFEGNHYTNYEGTQLQRKLETRIRQYKDRQIGAKAIDDSSEVEHCDNKIRQLSEKYHKLSKESGLPTKLDRLQVEGYRKSEIDDSRLSLNASGIIDKKIIKTYEGNIKGQDYISKIEEYENNIFKEKVENAIIIEEGGDIYKFVGKENYVDIEGNFKNAIITHNHPTFEDEIGGSFGKDDFNTLLKHQDIKELRVVDAKYTYRTRVLKTIQEKDYDDAMMSVIPIEGEDFKHLIFEELKKKGLIEYERRVRKMDE